jgi:archaellum component FlaC
MTSIVNLFSNFNDLTKPKSVTNNVSKYKIETSSYLKNSPSVVQGLKFKKYQDKIYNNLENRIKKTDLIEGFENLESNQNSLSEQTNELISKYNFSSQDQNINNLKNEYETTLKEYQDLKASITNNVTKYVDRVNPNNIYLGKVIKFQDGNMSYVTMKGIAKWIQKSDILNKIAEKKGIKPEKIIQINLPWSTDYQTSGATIPTNPILITGTPVVIGQSLGNEGSNVFVNSIVNNPKNKYVDCYNNSATFTEIMFVPPMNSSNLVNSYQSLASSIYKNDNSNFGPWRAFNRGNDWFWHSEVSSSTGYNSKTGEYTGSNFVNYVNSSGESLTAKGEFITINLPGVNTSNPTSIPITKYELQGRNNCSECGNPSGRTPNSWLILGYKDGTWYLVDQRDNQEFIEGEIKTYTISNPTPYQGYIFITIICGSSNDNSGNRYCVQIAQWNLYTSSNYVSTNAQTAMTNAGQMNFEQCQSYAIESGNRYFGIQTIDDNGIGNCMISNDLATTQIYGVALKYTNSSLWSSNTIGDIQGSIAILNGDGTLSVNNSLGSSVFSTPIPDTAKSDQGSYIGCYKMPSSFAKNYVINNSKDYSTAFNDCQDLATNNGYQYFAVQGAIKGDNPKRCLGFNDLETAQQKGVSKNCKTQTSGGSGAGNLYSTSETLYSFLMLQDDGNMCIYRGTSPSDNQSVIWCSETNGKQLTPNPNFTAEKGKYGKNFMVSDSTLAPGEFIGSNDGSIYLIMQSDGNLVLYTSSSTSKCNVSQKFENRMIGGEDTNAVYKIMRMGNKDSIGKLAYVDQNSGIHTYPSDNVMYSDIYTVYNGFDSVGNDITDAAYGNSTVEQCQSSCNSNQDCAGFTFSDLNKVCYPKTSSMFPNGERVINSNVNLYTRNKKPLKLPIGVPGTVVNIDSIKYDNYNNEGEIGKSYGLSNATSIQKKQLSQIEDRLNLLTSQINDYTGKFDTGSNSLNNQATKNFEGLGDYLKDFFKTNNNITNFNTNVENILKDSDITVLQKNYDYLFWSILAVGTVLVTMNIVKKQ